MFQVDQSELKDRLFFTNDFVAIYTCQTYDSQHLYDCFEISSNALEINQCTIDIKGSERMGACSESTFMINMKTGQKFFPGVDKTYTECVNQTTGEFNTKNVRGSMEKWLETMRKSGQDPFWSLEPSEEPLDPKDPKIDISLPAYQGRHAYMHEQMVLRSSNRLLHVGPMVDGKIQGKINASLADANDWKAPLLLVPARESGATETTGHGNSGRKSMAEDFSTSIKAGRGMTVSGSSDLMSHILFTARIRHGRLHGPVRLFGQLSNDPEALCQERLNWGLSFVGNYKDGVATGYCWKGLLGGAWVVGYVDENGDLTGDNIAYVYPDFKTAFVGKFEKGIMVW